jgi:hypothetical protein
MVHLFVLKVVEGGYLHLVLECFQNCHLLGQILVLAVLVVFLAGIVTAFLQIISVLVNSPKFEKFERGSKRKK